MVQKSKTDERVTGAEAEAEAPSPTPFNLGAFALGDISTMELQHPDELNHPDEGIGVFVDVAGADTSDYLRAQQAILDKKLKRSKGNVGKMEKIQADEIPAAIRTFAVAVTRRFHGQPLTDPEFGTVPEVPTDQLKTKLFAKYPWMAEQIVEWSRERANYFRPAE